MMHFLIICLLGFSLIGCSLKPTSLNAPSVEVSKGVQLQLPTPEQLGYKVSASQLVAATWEGQTQQLPVQLEVSKDSVVLAGFSSWGTRILSLEYQNDQISANVLKGLEETLPKPEQVLFNLMLTLWPMEAWYQPLSQIQWYMVESGNIRTIKDETGSNIIVITYQKDSNINDRLSGVIEFQHAQLGYTINIQTLSYTKNEFTEQSN
ncbi:DUF3261 domain-containing protein [Vibrio profundi]|uniref:DUF3261 domain-containing protein n=1 Tax=Vibrio profundi TaxID=1774960 RepID=UPI0037368611